MKTHGHRIASWATVWMLAAALVRPAWAREPVNILAVGDSITQGGKSGRKEYTYRWPLVRMLADEGACFRFIGTRTNGIDADFQWPGNRNSANEGYYGAKTAFVRDKLVESLKKIPAPDLALVHLGTNDADGSVEKDIVKPLSDIVAMLRKANPAVTILLAKIPARFPMSVYLHYQMDRLAAATSTPKSKVLIVDFSSEWSPDQDTFDGVHPNLLGQRKMAERWLLAMRPFLDLAAGTAGCSSP